MDNPSESRLQAEIFQYHWNHYPHERGLLFHVNNKARNAIEGNRFKAMGVVRGVSDLIYLKPGGRPILMELKLDEGKQSPEQLKWEALVKEAGYDYRVIRTLEEAMKHFETRIPPPRVTSPSIIFS